MTLSEQNRIDAEPIMAVVRDYLSHQIDMSESHMDSEKKWLAPMTVLALDAQIRPNTLSSMLRGRIKTIDFDLADQLLKAMDKTHLWWSHLNEVYLSATLNDSVCRRAPGKWGTQEELDAFLEQRQREDKSKRARKAGLHAA